MSDEEFEIVEPIPIKELSAEHWQIVVDATNADAESVHTESDDEYFTSDEEEELVRAILRAKQLYTGALQKLEAYDRHEYDPKEIDDVD